MEPTMKQRRHISGGIWFVMGVVLAAALIPAATIAATALTRIQGSSGTTANVTKAGQLLTVESAPSTYHRDGYYLLDSSDPTCVQLIAPIGGRALIVTQIDIDVAAGSAANGNAIVVFPSKDCSGAEIFLVNTTGPGAIEEPLVPGFPVPVGSGLSAKAVGTGVLAEIAASGYLVISTDVP